MMIFGCVMVGMGFGKSGRVVRNGGRILTQEKLEEMEREKKNGK